MPTKKKFNKILADIKKVKIQGARNIARAALYAYSLQKTKEAKKRLINARPTEPMLVNVLNKAEKIGYEKTLAHFDSAQNSINKSIIKIIKDNSVIFTHCHSTNVVRSLIYAKRKGIRFQVYNTETRPLFQGRITSKELKKAGVKVTEFVDSAVDEILEGNQGIKKPDLVLLGADAILNSGVINKIGSGMIAEIAKVHHVPLFIVADSWKYSQHYVKLEERNYREVWNSRKVKIRNLVFEKVDKKDIKKIVSELGILNYSEFLKKVKKN